MVVVDGDWRATCEEAVQGAVAGLAVDAEIIKSSEGRYGLRLGADRASACRLRDALDGFYLCGCRLSCTVVLEEENHPLLGLQAWNVGGGTEASARTTTRPAPPAIAQLRTIHWCVQHVLAHGPAFEAALMGLEGRNPFFEFLYPPSPLHAVYRELLVALAAPQPPPPPPQPLHSSVAPDRKKYYLGRAGLRRLETMLRYVGRRRGSVARVMGFAVDHAHAKDEVVQVVCASITSQTAPWPARLHRLYALNDILHNVDPTYSALFVSRLPQIFSTLAAKLPSSGRFAQERARSQLLFLLSTWESHNLIDPALYHALKSPLIGSNYDGAPLPKPLTNYYNTLAS